MDLTQLIGGGAVGSAAMQSAAAGLVQSPEYLQNRERLAAVTELGYEVMDFYDAYQPVLFILGLLGTAIGGTALAKRRTNPEAVALYGISTVVSAAVAWLTRPAFLRPAPAPVPEGAVSSPGALGETLGWLDHRAAGLTAAKPGWEAQTLARLLGDLGTGTLDPASQTLITANSH